MNTRTRLATATLSLVAVVGMLHTSVLPTAACTCFASADEQEIRSDISYYDLVVEGTLATFSESSEKIRFLPAILYSGQLTGDVVIDQEWSIVADDDRPQSLATLNADCGYTLLGNPGDKYVLFLRQNPVVSGSRSFEGTPGTYQANGCSSFAIDEIGMYGDNTQDRYEAIKRVTNGGTAISLPSERDSDELPLVPVAVGASALALAVVAAVILRARLA